MVDPLNTHYTKPPTSTALRVGFVGGFVPFARLRRGAGSGAHPRPLHRPVMLRMTLGETPRPPVYPERKEPPHDLEQ